MAKKWLHVFKHTTDEWSDFYGGGGGLPRTSDFVNIDEDKFSQWIVDVTNENYYQLSMVMVGHLMTMKWPNIQMDIGKVCGKFK